MLNTHICVYIPCYLFSSMLVYTSPVRVVYLFFNGLYASQVSTLFKNWYQICEVSGANDTACSQYVLHLHQTGLLKGDDTTESFFRILLVIDFLSFHSIHTSKIFRGLMIELGCYV